MIRKFFLNVHDRLARTKPGEAPQLFCRVQQRRELAWGPGDYLMQRRVLQRRITTRTDRNCFFSHVARRRALGRTDSRRHKVHLSWGIVIKRLISQSFCDHRSRRTATRSPGILERGIPGETSMTCRIPQLPALGHVTVISPRKTVGSCYLAASGSICQSAFRIECHASANCRAARPTALASMPGLYSAEPSPKPEDPAAT